MGCAGEALTQLVSFQSLGSKSASSATASFAAANKVRVLFQTFH